MTNTSSRFFLYTFLLIFSAPLMSGCATWNWSEQGYPFFNVSHDTEKSLRENINKSWAELNAIASTIAANKSWALKDIEEEIFRRSLDVREKGSYPEPIPEMVVSYNGETKTEAYVWRFARMPQHSLALPTSSWRRVERVGYTLQVDILQGKIHNVKASITTLSDKDFEFSSKHFVSGSVAAGSTLYLIGGPSGT
ncbi:MAG: hypothetical protein ACREP8_11840 [Candidatus Binatia bacterium]